MLVIFGVLKSWEHAATFSKSGGRQRPGKQGFYPNIIESSMHPASNANMEHWILISCYYSRFQKESRCQRMKFIVIEAIQATAIVIHLAEVLFVLIVINAMSSMM